MAGFDRQDSRHENAQREFDQRDLQATSLSRNTIKKWLSTPQSAAPKYRRRDVSTTLAPFVATLTQALEVDGNSPTVTRLDGRYGATRTC